MTNEELKILHSHLKKYNEGLLNSILLGPKPIENGTSLELLNLWDRSQRVIFDIEKLIKSDI